MAKAKNKKTGNKSGRVTKDEIEYIGKNLDKTDKELAETLKKNPSIIKSHRIKLLAKGHRGAEEYPTFNIRSRPWFKGLSKKFTSLEQETFIWEWDKIISQFRGDVSHTEELQITSLVETIILLDRNLEERKDSVQQMERLTKLLENLYNIQEDSRGPTWQSDVANIEGNIAAIRACGKSNTDERVKLEKNKVDYLEGLNSTRAARNVLDTRQSWSSLLKQVEDAEFREREGKQAELLHMASEKELERLQQPIVYNEDDPVLSVDYPILNCELVEKLKKQKEQMEELEDEEA